MRAIISRYAPAPTGYLHLGHVLNAIYVWGVANLLAERSATASAERRVLLRIEDHDAQRSRKIYEDAILGDLAWLGFVADDPPVRQSERSRIHERALATLRARGLIYVCACSRKEVQGIQEVRDRERRYAGTCRDRGLGDGPGMSLRVRLEPTIERFVDLRLGPHEQRPAEQCGDLLVRDREGNWTYQFAAAVDDFDQGVTHVIRGEDLLESTGRQIALARLLGRVDPARFLHHGLLMKSATQKISKSDGDTGVRELRARGWTPENVIGLAAAQAGLIPFPRAIRAAEVSSIMSLEERPA
jgi:glutamyl-tRNA synthetase/glutamyl-Q tRNA(Asp) synthetase